MNEIIILIISEAGSLQVGVKNPVPVHGVIMQALRLGCSEDH